LKIEKKFGEIFFFAKIVSFQDGRSFAVVDSFCLHGKSENEHFVYIKTFLAILSIFAIFQFYQSLAILSPL
jgi:hypothetical protein